MESKKDEFLSIKADEVQNCRWTALYLPLKGVDFSKIAIFGVAIRSQSHTSSVVSTLSLRVGNSNGFDDNNLKKNLICSIEDGVHLDIIRVAENRDLYIGHWHELVLFFSNSAFDISLKDIQIFSL